MISEKVREAFEDQINRELYSAYLYQAMASYCEAANYAGTAKGVPGLVMTSLESVVSRRKYVYVT